ncbi:hypothetical protein LTS18_005793 [Coniosporium uncinatum]|uniref:Uncharacterized protein n=1 Tax=Coniosporium uncinatum TaxID=93489 RepID=A0ACC3D4T7_9PEZI|nr:hypothetical protein LTS18_005793 [Coniosporium uncinatum]
MPPLTCSQQLRYAIPDSLSRWRTSTSMVTAASFSTSARLSANPPKKGNSAQSGPPKRGVRALTIKKTKRAVSARPPAPGERKALRKRIVLSNTNALEVPGLQEMSASNVGDETFHGKMLALPGPVIDSLRVVEAFHTTQGWSMFRKPATLVRGDTVDLGKLMRELEEEKSTGRRVVVGEAHSGKSVLQLQALAMAFLREWVVVHISDAMELTNAHTEYAPVQGSNPTQYTQNAYAAALLTKLSKANKAVFSQLQLTRKHDLPIPVQSNISLDRFCDMGARDPEIAWPFWEALWAELTAPSGNGAKRRPPILLAIDNLPHVMKESEYLSREVKKIHAHDLLMVSHFMDHLSGRKTLPNGGLVLAATNESNKPRIKTLDFAIQRNEALQHEPTRRVEGELVQHLQTALRSFDFGTTTTTHIHPLLDRWESLSRRDIDDKVPVETARAITALLAELETLPLRTPRWNPFVPIDTRVLAALEGVHVQRLHGLSKDEARSVLEYYAASGLLRKQVTDKVVAENWTLSGGGIVGELEKAAVRRVERWVSPVVPVVGDSVWSPSGGGTLRMA